MSMNDIITLDVGGTLFRTSRSTLCKHSGSTLATMFDPESQIPPAVIKDGAYFMDNNPEIFKFVLDYLRFDEPISTKDLSENLVRILRKNADYLQLPNMIDDAKDTPNIPPEEYIQLNFNYGETASFKESDLRCLMSIAWKNDANGGKKFAYPHGRDHFICYLDTFQHVLTQAVNCARAGKLFKPGDYYFVSTDENRFCREQLGYTNN
jgi:hypothetical protein